ncbi:beta subunit of ribonucleoside-diphosphate reductase [Desarmillaria tabescens]|uniref:Beta subunit of ribonucleoside-diphosphate reductase n=1 Tax=Armillaria tabescens TaxID=1929756 RepID=A0AA39K1I8_ARMTA|nr:beta subunit of ribonucleoside-diphosphate reductase [Desarmillaria tabescens]KAK0452789.1 beta subunit of ribonucleoside-diphosphate reductase [Desarmillaria tabescens]
MEPILDGSMSARLQLFPIEYDELWLLYTKVKAAFWTSAEIDLTKDLPDWDNQLTNNDRHVVSTVLAFFTSSDAIVNENLITRFCMEVQIPEAHYFYMYQAMMENIHSEVYGLLIDTYIHDVGECTALFRAIDEHLTVKAKAEWALHWITDTSSFATCLVAFATVEGIFFSGSFALIAHDEGLHTLFAITLYRTLKFPLPGNVIVEIIHSAVDIEKAFWDGAFKLPCLRLDAENMKKYIEFVANYLLVGLSLLKEFNVVNPFDFMELISLEGKTNFFERWVGEYSHAFLSHNNVVQSFSTEEDF